MEDGGTVRPHIGFSASTDAEAIERAMRSIANGKWTKVFAILCHRSNAQRQMILTPYRIMFAGKDLIELLKRELGCGESIVTALMETPAKYDAMQLHKKMKMCPVNVDLDDT